MKYEKSINYETGEATGLNLWLFLNRSLGRKFGNCNFATVRLLKRIA